MVPTTTTERVSRTSEQVHAAAHRGGRRAGRVREWHGTGRDVNVGVGERVGSGLLGTALAAAGLLLLVRRRSILGAAGLAAAGAGLAYRGASGYCPGYDAVGVSTSDTSAASHPLSRFIHVSQRVRINRSVNDLYNEWRDLTNLPRIMRHVQRVDVRGNGMTHWVVIGPRDRRLEWDAQITDDRPNELIAWRSVDDADVPNRGHVRFTSPRDGHGSILEVELNYQPPAGALGAALAYAFGEAPSQQLHEDLRRFKQRMETGENATNVGQPRGHCR